MATHTRRHQTVSFCSCAGALAALLGCAEDSTRVVQRASASAPKYVAASVLFSPEGEQTYVNVLDDLGPQTLDYGRAVELAGWSDIWVHEGHLFVSSREERTVTKYSVDDASSLALEETLSFSSYGEVDVAFWSNTFVAADKAYMISGVAEYVIWNPKTMQITGTLPLPEMPARDSLLARAGTLDRSNVIRDGMLYQPMYWSDEDYTVFAPDSRIVVIDIATDEAVQTIDAPCAGLDIGSMDAAGNLYFSTWTGGVYQPLALGGSGNCAAKIAAGADTAEVAFTFSEVAGGREGAAVRHFEGERLMLSVFHDERSGDLAAAEDPWAAIGDLNWRTWLYNPTDGSSAPLEALDWNSGATYVYPMDGSVHVMVPSTDYAATTVVAVGADSSVTRAFDMRGWGIRLFRLR